jgi:hypothetical protein
MTQIARRILQYRGLKGDALDGPGFEAEIQLLNEVNDIAMKHVTEAQHQWIKDKKQPGE